MIPHERELAEMLADKPFSFVGINSDESRSVLKTLMADEKITWPQIYDGEPGDGEIANRWNVSSWPTIYVLDHEGVIRAKDVRDQEMEDAVKELLAKLATANQDSEKLSD